MLTRSILAFAVIGIVLGAMGVGVHAAGSPTIGSSVVGAQEEIDPDRILIEIDIHANGSAHWNIHYRSRLIDNETEEAFSTIETDIATDPAPYTDRFGDRINQTVADASTVTGREMAVTNLSVATDRVFIPEEYGVVTYSFTWEQFARTSGSKIHVGDAIAGMFLDESTRLQIRYPGEYSVHGVQPPPTTQRDASVSWRGPIDFDTDEPTLILAPESAANETSSIGMPLMIGLVVVLLIIGGAGVLLRKRQSDPVLVEEERELLSNEEQVINVLESHGGRMKQQELVQELGWTDAKTSQVVGNLRDEGKLEGFRLGRENILKLPEDDDNAGAE
jgi:uncharacterized membrane protein